MGAHGYDGHLEILDSGDWLPQRRHRAYFAFSQRSLLQAKQVFQVASCIRSQCHNLQACLTHPAARRAVKKTCSKRCQREGRWVGKTAAFIREKQLDPEVIQVCDIGLQKSADFHCLTKREQVLLATLYAFLLQCKKLLAFSWREREGSVFSYFFIIFQYFSYFLIIFLYFLFFIFFYICFIFLFVGQCLQILLQGCLKHLGNDVKPDAAIHHKQSQACCIMLHCAASCCMLTLRSKDFPFPPDNGHPG